MDAERKYGIMRKQFLIISAIVAGSAILPKTVVAGDAGSQKPNIILCMTDDQGWGDTGYNGHPVLRTPHLDQMAKEGIRFDRFYASSPVCSPTRGSCITGRHPFRYGIPFANIGRMKAEEITLAEVLKAQGYATGHFGRWHLGSLTTRIKDAHRGRPGLKRHYSPPWEHGYDKCFVTESAVPTYWKDNDYESFGTQYWTGLNETVPAEDIVGDDSKLIMDRALPFIGKAAIEKTPFLAVIWFHAPHSPAVSAPPYTDGYDENKDYYGCITAMDEQMGRLRAELKSLAIEENTMLWFCSDNGPSHKYGGSTKGLRRRKGSLYEGGVRVPGLLVWPKMIQKARVVAVPCSTSDYFPTVLDSLGYQLPEAKTRPYDGISLMPLIRNEMVERPRPIAFETCRSQRHAMAGDHSVNQTAVIDNRYKIFSGDAGNTYELYDLVADQGETNNIAQQHPGIVKRMRRTLEAWRQSCKESSNGNDY